MRVTEPTVFVVDDDPSVCESLSLLLHAAGHHAETFPSAAAFLEAYDPERSGCLVLDLRMQGMTGLDLQERLASLHSDLPVIVLSAHGGTAMASRALERGAVDFVQKPFRDRELLETIERAIEENLRQRKERNATREPAAPAPRRQGDGS